jgi:hypothetical protein
VTISLVSGPVVLNHPTDNLVLLIPLYSKALLRISGKLEIFGCRPIELELSEAPEQLPGRPASSDLRVQYSLTPETAN